MRAPATENLRKGYLSAFIVVLIWSGFILVSRLGGKSNLTPYDVMALRFMVAGVLFLPFWLKKRTNLLNWRLLVLSLTGILIYGSFVFNGFRMAPANHAAILLPGFMPFAVTCIAYLILGEKVSRQRAIGLAIIAMGVGCVAIENFGASGFALKGDTLIIIGSLFWSTYTVLLRKWKMDPFHTTVAVTLLAVILFLPVYALFLPKGLHDTPWNGILLQALYQGIMAGFVQMILFTKSVHILGPTRLGLVMALVPVMVGIAAVPVLGEPLTPLICAGLLFVSLGAYLGNRQAPSKKFTLAIPD